MRGHAASGCRSSGRRYLRHRLNRLFCFNAGGIRRRPRAGDRRFRRQRRRIPRTRGSAASSCRSSGRSYLRHRLNRLYRFNAHGIRRRPRAGDRRFRPPWRKPRRMPGCAASGCRSSGRRFRARRGERPRAGASREARKSRSRAICCASSSGSRRNVAGGLGCILLELVHADHHRVAMLDSSADRHTRRSESRPG